MSASRATPSLEDSLVAHAAARRYLAPFDLSTLPADEVDYLVIGSGLAGLRAAIELSNHGSVVVLTKDDIEECNSWLAQGGIAAAMAEDDTVDLHAGDTLETGCGLSDRRAVELLVSEGPSQVETMIRFGAKFDRDLKDPSRLAFTREGAHSRNRVLHARGDATGLELTLTLINKARECARIRFAPRVAAIDLLTAPAADGGAVSGALVHDPNTRTLRAIRARATVVATGGIGHLFRFTTNSRIATGSGISIAARAGAAIADMEFVQFHPTALCLPNAPSFLISEAVRGEGAFLRDRTGARFMVGRHPLAELAPRDVVSRVSLERMKATRHPSVFLDLTHLDPELVKHRFPQIFRNCLAFGVDITTEPIPVAPSAHYMIGGIRTNLVAETNVPGLYAAGECAATYVHGANRLASNSLLECLVFGFRAAESARAFASSAAAHPAGSRAFDRALSRPATATAPKRGAKESRPLGMDGEPLIEAIRQICSERFSVVRDRAGIVAGLDGLKKHAAAQNARLEHPRDFAAIDMYQVACYLGAAALLRDESRGTHFRDDFPERDDQRFRKHILFRDGQVEHEAVEG